MKASRLEVRPVYVYSENRVRAHVFMCMLACHVEWHMRRKLAPMLFEDDDPEGARAKRATPVAKAEVSDRARVKARSRKTDDGLPAHSFGTLLADLGTPARNEAARLSRTSPRRAVSLRAAPSAAKTLAAPSPIPWDAPVINTFLFVSPKSIDVSYRICSASRTKIVVKGRVNKDQT